MSEFINTIDVLGDEAAQDALLEGTLTELEECRITDLRDELFRDSALEKAVLPLAAYADGYMFAAAKSLKRVSLISVPSVADRFAEGASALSVAHFAALKEIGGSVYAFVGTALDTLILSNRHIVATLSGGNHLARTPIANGTGYVYVRKKLVETYKAASNWSVFAAQFRAIEDYPEIQAIVDADLAEMRGGTA